MSLSGGPPLGYVPPPPIGYQQAPQASPPQPYGQPPSYGQGVPPPPPGAPPPPQFPPVCKDASQVVVGQVMAPIPSHHQVDGRMPPVPADAVQIVNDCEGQTLVNGIGKNIDIVDCTLVSCHLTGAYIRNSIVQGGAFVECTFKSCQMQSVRHCFECSLKDTEADTGCILTKPQCMERSRCHGQVQ